MFVGKVIAMSVVNGGPGPTFLSPVIVDYLFGGVSAVKPSVEDVLDYDIQTKISKVWEEKWNFVTSVNTLFPISLLIATLSKNSTLFSLMRDSVFGSIVV